MVGGLQGRTDGWRAVGTLGVQGVVQWGVCRVPGSAARSRSSPLPFPWGRRVVRAGGGLLASGSASRGCADAQLPHQQPLPSPAGAVPATGFLKQSGISIDSKGFVVVNKVSPGGSPCQGAEQE